MKLIDEKQSASIEKNKIVNRYLQHQNIFQEDLEVTGIYFIYKGIVKVFKSGAFNKDQIVRFSLKGDILGHRGLGPTKYYPVSAESISESTICYFSKTFFYELLNNSSKLSIELMFFYANELNNEEAKLRDMSIFTVREKVAKTILYFAETFGLNEKSEINHFESLNRQDVGDFAGLTPNQITKGFGEFKNERIITTEGKRIKLLSPTALKKIITY